MQTDSYNISILPGDGIGEEIAKEARKIIDWISSNATFNINLVEEYVGGASIDKFGTPLSDETLKSIKQSDAILLGAVGGPKWEKMDFEKRPERGLLKIRKELDLFANYRPAIVFDPLIDSSSLKPEVIKDLDILIIRELTSGIYFGEPRGIEKIDDNIKLIGFVDKNNQNGESKISGNLIQNHYHILFLLFHNILLICFHLNHFYLLFYSKKLYLIIKLFDSSFLFSQQ